MSHRFLRSLSSFAVSTPRLTLAALLLGVLAPRAAVAVQSAELLRTQAYFYGRFEARVRFAPGEGVVSSFFLWKDGSSSTTSWNELDYEKVNSTCRLQTNIWTGQGTQSAVINTPAFDICADYHTYAFEWTPDYIAWLIDGTQIRKVTGASVTEYTQNASQGMTFHFNIWEGNSGFGGTLDASTLPVHQYISWVQYSSYANGAFQQQWREDFNGPTLPSGWSTGNWSSPFNLSTHNPANVGFPNGYAVLSMTADGATGYSGTPPVDSTGGGPGTGGAAGSGTGGAAAGTGGRTGAGGTVGGAGGRGTGGGVSSGSGGASSAGTGGSADGTAGNGAGGASAGIGGSGTGGPSGTGGADGQNPGGTGGAGQAGSPGLAGGDSGCACAVAATGGGRAMAALLLLAAVAGARRRVGRSRRKDS